MTTTTTATPTRDDLILGHYRDAKRIARHLCKGEPWIADEAESEALLRLVQAADAWRPGERSFRRFLYQRLTWARSDLLRAYPEARMSDLAPGVAERFAAPAPAGPCSERAASLCRDVLALATPRQATALRLRHGLDGEAMTYEEVGRAMGTSRQGAQALVGRGRARARERLATDRG